MADGYKGSTVWSEPGYAETDRSKEGENHSFTDYSQATKSDETQSPRSIAFQLGQTEGRS